MGGPVPELTKGLGTLGRTIERRGEGWLGSAPLNDEAGDGIKNRVDETVPANARVWDRWLGGKDNFEVDHRVADQIATTRWRPHGVEVGETPVLPQWGSVAVKR